MDAREKIGELFSKRGADPAKSSYWTEKIILAGVVGGIRQDAAEEAWHPKHAADLAELAVAYQTLADFQLGPTALSAFLAASNLTLSGLAEEQEQAKRLALAARLAEVVAENSRTLSRGRKPKGAAAEITRVARLAFEDVTGTHPRRINRDGIPGGPFVELLKEIFAAMGVDASADAQARTYGKK